MRKSETRSARTPSRLKTVLQHGLIAIPRDQDVSTSLAPKIHDQHILREVGSASRRDAQGVLLGGRCEEAIDHRERADRHQASPSVGEVRNSMREGRPLSGRERMSERQWRFVPLWGMVVFLVYALRRIDCRSCGPTVERVPWSSGKFRIREVFRLYLAQWARHLSWAETAEISSVASADVYGAVRWVVDYGLKHRDLTGVTAIGVDEVHVGKREKFWTLVYQIDDHCKRLLWIGHDRTEKTFDSFFESFGSTFCSGIAFICSDMWKPYLNAAARGVALYHALAKLPEPQFTHSFF